MALSGGGTSTRLATLFSPRALVAGRREARRASSRTRADKTDRVNHGRSRCTARGRSTDTERVHWRVSVLCLFACACACMCACARYAPSDHFEELLANSQSERAPARACVSVGVFSRARACVSVGVFLRARVCVCVCLSAFVRACVRAFMHTARRRLTSSWSC